MGNVLMSKHLGRVIIMAITFMISCLLLPVSASRYLNAAASFEIGGGSKSPEHDNSMDVFHRLIDKEQIALDTAKKSSAENGGGTRETKQIMEKMRKKMSSSEEKHRKEMAQRTKKMQARRNIAEEEKQKVIVRAEMIEANEVKAKMRATRNRMAIMMRREGTEKNQAMHNTGQKRL